MQISIISHVIVQCVIQEKMKEKHIKLEKP